MRLCFASLALGIAVLCNTTAAFAQDVAGKLQLGLDVGLFSISKSTLSPDDPRLGDDVDLTVTGVGTTEQGDLLVGYGLSNDVTLAFSFGASHMKIETGENSEVDITTFTLAPTLDYMFGGETARVFVGGGLSAAVGTSDQTGVELSQTSFGTLALLGVRVFLDEAVSLNPTLLGGYSIGSGSAGDEDETSVDFGVSGYTIGLSLGLSGWI